MIRRLLVPGLLAGVAACGTTTDENPPIQNINRPVDIAFTCYGQMRITGDGVADPTDELVYTPQPVASCTARTKAWSDTLLPGSPQPSVPPGQEDLTGQAELGLSMYWLGFAVQPASGTVAVIEADIPQAEENNPKLNAGAVGKPQVYPRNRDPSAVSVLDGDLLTPGKNALTVGSLPVAIAADASGCYMATANAGSCDLSVINVERVYERSSEPLVRQLSVTTPAGDEVLGRPGAMISDLRPSPIGVACPAVPQGNLYIAYPDCHAIAVVDAATGVVQSTIRFDDTGTATIGDGNLSCIAECGDERMPTPDGARPVTLELRVDEFSNTRRLAIGLDNRPVVTVVDLDESYLPTATIEQYELQGDVGVIDVALTPVISMTGQEAWQDGILPTRAAQFVYAVATDSSVRVIDVYNVDHECDTQIDPRFLQGATTLPQLNCFLPGQLGTPQRRAFANGPGIQLPNGDAPLSVAAVAAGPHKVQVGTPPLEWDRLPTQTIGYFAFVTSSLGLVYVVNIDDDNYPDLYNSANPLQAQQALTMPHQLRDGTLRGGDADSARTGENLDGDIDCDDRGGFVEGSSDPLGMPRADNIPTSFFDSSRIASNKSYQMPYVRRLLCDGVVDRALPEVMFATPAAVRANIFPDIHGVPIEEDWTFQWEGSLSLDDGLETAVDGPQVRTAIVSVGGGALRIHDPSKPYCDAGVEKYDNVQLVGCSPSQGDAQCGLGERCFVHPDSTVEAGACLPADQVDNLAGACRDFMVSVRRFAVQQVTSGELVLSERRRVLRTSPVNGCTTDMQCQELADYNERLTSDKHPIEDNDTPSADLTYVCAPDPTRSGDINRCQIACNNTEECEEGTVCSGGFCLEGTMPPPECLGGLQRYTINATEALVAVGSRTGYVHNLVEGENGVCEPDLEASPLKVGRIKLNPPACTGDGVADLTPNPCSLTVDHTELVPNYDEMSVQKCDLVDSGGVLRTTPVQAIRFRNQVFNLTITDPTYPGDRECRHDRDGGRTGVPVVYPGFTFGFHLIAGFRFVGGAVSVMPSKIVATPDDVLWVVDEGDVVGTQGDPLNIQGQILRINADVPTGATAIR